MAATLMHNFGGAGGVMTSVDRFKLSADLNCILKKDLSSDQRLRLEKLGIYSTGYDDIILDKGFAEALLGQLRKELKTVVDDGRADVQPSSEDDDYAAKTVLRAAILKSRFAETIAKANGAKSELSLEKLGIYSTGNDDIILDKGFDGALLGQLRKELKTVVDDGEVDVQPSSEDDDHAAKRVLRAAILKSRFAETIAKANGGKSEPRKANKKTQSLERRRCQEAKIKPSTTKEEFKQEDELKRQCNKEREAARKALELVERNVQVDDNFKVMKEFEMLSQCSICYTDRGYGPEMALRERKSGKVLHPLQKLGFHIKKEFLADDDDCEEHQAGTWKKRKY